MTSIEDTLAERQKAYGDFEDVAALTSELMGRIACYLPAGSIRASHHLALQMICQKMARLVCGDINHEDSWRDIEGYARLARGWRVSDGA